MTGLLALALIPSLLEPGVATVHISAGTPVHLQTAGVTAAYSLDADCAEVEVAGGIAVVSGKRACSTHVIAIAGDSIVDTEVFVAAKRGSLDPRRAGSRLHEGGSVSSSYSSLPAELETSFNVSRSEGDRATSMAFSVGHGHAFSSVEKRTTLNSASVNFTGPRGAVTLFDSRVEQSPLTADDIVIRGLHMQRDAWFMHAGIASMTGFRQEFLESDPDWFGSTGYRFKLSEHSSLIPSFSWISASSRYLSGKTGAIGSLTYDYQLLDRMHFAAEVGVSHGVGASASADYTGEQNNARLQFRATPSRFAALSSTRAPGLQAIGSWARQLRPGLVLDFDASQDTYSLLDGTSQKNASWSSSLQKRLTRRFTLTGGIAGSIFTRHPDYSVISTSVPITAAYESGRFGDSFQYRYGRNQASNLGSHSFRDSLRVSAGPTTFTLFASRQTQTPTVEYVLNDLPWLRQALLSAGVSATTPEEIQEFLRTNADLIAAGYLHDLQINISPVHNQVGGTFHWASPRRLVSTRLESRWDQDQRIRGTLTSTFHDARVSIRLDRHSDVTLQASLFTTRGNGLSSMRIPVYSIGIRRQLSSIPDLIGPYANGVIQGRVYADASGIGMPENTDQGIAGITVVLDGNRRVQTNPLGLYSFHGVGSGSHTVEVAYEGTRDYVFTSAPNVSVEENSTVNFGIARRKATIFGVVLNDAGKPIGNASVRIRGPQQDRVDSNSSGEFSLNTVPAGTYVIDIDPDSLPPFYDLEDLTSKTLAVTPATPARAEFVVRALRTVSGQVRCAEGGFEAGRTHLLLDNKDVSTAMNHDGGFALRDLTAGTHELAVRYGELVIRQDFELPANPATLKGVVIDVCRPISKERMSIPTVGGAD
jgi:hypothetical protein